jgi:predicted HNH restriction endonuclease
MTWRDAVSGAISRLTLKRRSNLFTRQLIIDEELPLILTSLQSRGATPAQTLSRILQDLRDAGEIEFIGRGEYRLVNSAIPPVNIEQIESAAPTPRRGVTVDRIVRDAAIARRLKILYGYRCQICDTRLELKSGFYCEAHHIKPLGRPNNGPDKESNLIIVCPNHHTLLDFGAMRLVPTDFKHAKHSIAQEFIDFHNKTLFEGG